MIATFLQQRIELWSHSYFCVKMPFFSTSRITVQKNDMVCCIHIWCQNIWIIFRVGIKFNDFFFFGETQTLRIMKYDLLIPLIAETLAVWVAMTSMNSDLAIFYAAHFVQAEFRVKPLNLK